jgi:hypothetical protein
MRQRRATGRCVLLLLCAALVGPAATAQPLVPPLSDGATASLVTVTPGEAVYSRFGHTGIRIHDPVQGLDVLYNYGTFRFDRWFLFRFAYGALDYELSSASFPRALAFYRDVEHRGVVAQTLAMTPAQVQVLFERLEENLRPENRTYRYDFLFDNCATRPRDMIERVLGEALVRPPPRSSGHTFRSLIDPYVSGAPLVHLGIDLGLGTPVDRLATAREATFLPDSLFTYAAAWRLRTPTGVVPLVLRTDTLATVVPLPRDAFPWPGLVIGLLSAWGIAVTVRDASSGRNPRRRWLDGLVFGVAGVAGLVLAFLGFVSLHGVTFPNVHLLWAVPTHLVLAVSMRRHRTLRAYAWAAVGAAVAFLLLWPVWPQVVPLSVFPFVALVGLRALVRAWQGERGRG